MPSRSSAPDALEPLRRGAVDLIDEGDLARKLAKGTLTVKVGFDPSAPDIHLGHTVILRKMRHFQDAGHRVVFVIGDFTGMIGDPSGKKTTRPQLTREEIEENARTYTKQAFKILDAQKTVIEFNSRWLNALGSAGLVRLAARVTVARILERDDFQKRWTARQPIALHELLYPLAQGYDSVALKADVELGGTDQLFNLLVGRDLMRAEGLDPQVVMTLPLLVGTDGVEKMGKSLGNWIGIEEPADEQFGKVMSIPDSVIGHYATLATDLPPAEVAEIERDAAAGGPAANRAKRRVAAAVVELYHGREAAEAAERRFDTVHRQHEVPDDVPERSLPAGDPVHVPALLVELGFARSSTAARRLVDDGAIRVDGTRLPAREYDVARDRLAGHVLAAGRRNLVRLTD